MEFDELVDTAKGWLGLASDQVGADSKHVYLMVGFVESFYRFLVDVVAGDDLDLAEVMPKLVACLLNQPFSVDAELC